MQNLYRYTGQCFTHIVYIAICSALHNHLLHWEKEKKIHYLLN